MRFRIWNSGLRISGSLVLLVLASAFANAQIPEPGPAKSVNIPAVKETKLKNGLTIAVVEKPSVPIVTASLVIRSGADSEEMAKAGLANMTASMLTKGTKTRTAEQIAEQMEFLGASINSGAGWNNSNVTMNVTSDKLDQAMAIMADVVLNPSFTQKELDLLKSQSLDELKYNLTQPAFLASYLASVRVFDEHPAAGTPESLGATSRADLLNFYKESYYPENAVLILTGDITSLKAKTLAESFFGRWRNTVTRKEIIASMTEIPATAPAQAPPPPPLVRRITVIDLPGSGQASVTYALTSNRGRVDFGNGAPPTKPSVPDYYYPALALNSLLGGGYSSRLNQEIRIKRGLSYGAGSGFAWRWDTSNFSTRTQTKNQSAAEVIELVLAEIKKLSSEQIAEAELGPRKAVLTGGFGRNLETSTGIADALADLYTFEIPTGELNKYVGKVTSVSGDQVNAFARNNLTGGEVIVVGDYSIFKDDLAKRFPGMQVEVIKAANLDITSPTLKKSDIP
jgi:zinc protease